ncbi:MAG: hypothetical protein HYV26_06525, partial [Candidatus Hydrogenedentes bacterium]|nr:hypothetical protein [Candidatus Hydrogenedentota bacterium]
LLNLSEARTVVGTLSSAQFDVIDTSGDNHLSEAELRAAANLTTPPPPPADGCQGAKSAAFDGLRRFVGDFLALGLTFSVLAAIAARRRW